MTRNEAMIELKNGKRISHRFFLENEFLVMKNGCIYTEDDHNVQGFDGEYWMNFKGGSWEKDWIVIEESTMNPEIKKLESSILQNVAAITCNSCLRTEINEDSANDIPNCAEQFYNDGWRDVDGIVYCTKCISIKSITA